MNFNKLRGFSQLYYLRPANGFTMASLTCTAYLRDNMYTQIQKRLTNIVQTERPRECKQVICSDI